MMGKQCRTLLDLVSESGSLEDSTNSNEICNFSNIDFRKRNAEGVQGVQESNEPTMDKTQDDIRAEMRKLQT